MKNFLKKNKELLLVLMYVEIALLPTQVLIFVKEGQFLDLGLFLTSILLVVFTVPVYNILKKRSDNKKGL